MENLSAIRAIIRAHDLTIEEAAKKAKVSRVYMSLVLNGNRQMKKETLIIFLKSVGITYDQYLQLEEYKNNLELIDMSYEKKWQLLLLQVLLNFFTNYNMNMSKQKSKIEPKQDTEEPVAMKSLK